MVVKRESKAADSKSKDLDNFTRGVHYLQDVMGFMVSVERSLADLGLSVKTASFRLHYAGEWQAYFSESLFAKFLVDATGVTRIPILRKSKDELVSHVIEAVLREMGIVK